MYPRLVTLGSVEHLLSSHRCLNTARQFTGVLNARGRNIGDRFLSEDDDAQWFSPVRKVDMHKENLLAMKNDERERVLMKKRK